MQQRRGAVYFRSLRQRQRQPIAVDLSGFRHQTSAPDRRRQTGLHLAGIVGTEPAGLHLGGLPFQHVLNQGLFFLIEGES